MYIRIYKILPLLIILGAFGPYITLNFGLRTEQLAGYCLFILFLPKIISPYRSSLRLDKTSLLIALLWSSIVAFVLISAFASYSLHPPTLNDILAGLDNYLLCLAVFLAVSSWQFNNISANNTVSLEDVLCKCAQLVCFLLSINTILTLCQITSFCNVNKFLAYFWSESMSIEYGESVASLVVVDKCRLTGIFNQPFECGLMYSIGLILCAYRYVASRTLGLWNFLIFVSIIAGGMIGGSKVFILGGIPLAVIYVVSRTRFTELVKRYLFLGIISILAIFALLNINEATWPGTRTLKVYFRLNPDSARYRSALELYSGRRFGGDGRYVEKAFKQIWDRSPFFGLGLGNARIVLDNAYIAMYKLGGMPGAALYIIFMVFLLYITYKKPFVKDFPEEAKLLRYLVVLFAIAGMGAPSFTINRAGPVIWVLLGLILPYTCLRPLGCVNRPGKELVIGPSA